MERYPNEDHQHCLRSGPMTRIYSITIVWQHPREVAEFCFCATICLEECLEPWSHSPRIVLYVPGSCRTPLVRPLPQVLWEASFPVRPYTDALKESFQRYTLRERSRQWVFSMGSQAYQGTDPNARVFISLERWVFKYRTLPTWRRSMIL